VIHWGANAVEIEIMRYRPRRELTNTLRGYDIIQVVTGSPALALAGTGVGVPIVLQVATRVAWERKRLLEVDRGVLRFWRKGMTALGSSLERNVLRKVDAVLVENRVMAEYVRSCGQNRVITAMTGVDTAAFSPATDGWRRNRYLLSVCRLGDARKGLERMIRAYSKMVQSDDYIPPLVLAGSGQLPPPLLRLAANLGLSSRVSVRSDVDASDLAEIYRGASVFLQTSYEEGLGISILEAMASGLPVVCTDTAGARETVLVGQTGWLVPQGSDSEVSNLVAERVLEILRGDGAPMGRRARQRCEQTFATGVALRPFTDVYEDLLLRRKT
jgi:glycosyltransferase involved in cell wall biosynthesis